MGATFSSTLLHSYADRNGSSGSSLSSKPSLGDLPENCAALILGYMEPPEICKLARVNRAFWGASWADFVWESKLPHNYEIILNKIFGDFQRNWSKRGIYSRLCRTNTFDGGTKKVWLDKSSGGICMSMASKGLSITGIDDRRYWNYIQTEESRFSSVAYLLQIWWFEVTGEVEFPYPVDTYSIFFRLHLGRASKRFGRRICDIDHIHGWDINPVKFQLSTSDGQCSATQCFLYGPGKWTYYHVGDFVVSDANPLTKIKFSLSQIDCTHTKGGLCLDSLLIYPYKLGKRLKPFLQSSQPFVGRT